jgi:hypothetical protein
VFDRLRGSDQEESEVNVTWYYLIPFIDADDIIAAVIPDAETIAGPIELSQLTALVRGGWLPDDVMVSRDREHWKHADRIPEFLLALPLDRDRIIREYIEYGETPGSAHWGWASRRMHHIIADAPDIAWELVTSLIDLAPSDQSLGYFAAGPLEDLLSEHAPYLIARVEDRARDNETFRRALQGVWRQGMADDLWQRVQRAAKRSGS